MFHKILVALDYSTRSQQALDEAIELAKLAHAEILLIHVLSPSDQAYPIQAGNPVLDIGVNSGFSQEMMQLYAQQLQQFEQENLKRLQVLVKEVYAQGVPVNSTQVFGEAGSEICHTAETWQADLIAIGRRGRTGLKEVLLGSVSNYVMHHAPCSVMVIQKEESIAESIKQQKMTIV
jgi:nucleotide-binding universal stress UspA family protein